MAFGSRHCWGIALLLLVITQVMLTTAYKEDHAYSSSRSRGSDGYGHDDINHHDRSSHIHNDRDSKEHEYGHSYEDSAATTVRAMFQTTMLVGTSLMLYWI